VVYIFGELLSAADKNPWQALFSDLYIGIALIVFQADIKTRLILLDKASLQDKGIVFRRRYYAAYLPAIRKHYPRLYGRLGFKKIAPNSFF